MRKSSNIPQDKIFNKTMKDGDLDSDTKNLDDVEVEDSFSKQAMTAVISPLSEDL